MIFKRVQNIICTQFEIDPEDVTMDTTLEDIDADSLDLVDLAMSLEDEFNMEFPDEAIEEIHCVGDIVKYIEEN